MDIKKIINEELYKLYTAEYVAEYIYNSLSDEQKEDNDWSFNEYYQTIKNFGNNFTLTPINPQKLKFNEDFDVDTVEEYKERIQNGEIIPPIVIDSNYEIIDGNHRAKASLDLGKEINAFIPYNRK